MNPKLKLIILSALSVCFAAKRLGIRASVYLLAYFTALNVFAQSLYVNGTAYPAESGKTYVATGPQTPALRVSGSLASYSGTRIALSATFNNSDEMGRAAVYVTAQGSLALYDSTLTMTGTAAQSVFSGSVNAHLERVIITGSSSGFLVTARNAASMTMVDVTVQNDAGAGVNIDGATRLSAEGLQITTDGHGLQLNEGTARLSDIVVRTTGSQAYGLVFGGNNGAAGGYMQVDYATVTTAGIDSHGIFMTSGSGTGLRELVMTDSAINAANGSALDINDNHQYTFSTEDLMHHSGTYIVSIRNSTLTGTAALNIATLRYSTSGEPVNIPTTVNLVVENSTLNGDANFKGSSTSTVNFSDHTKLNGNLTVSDTAALILTLDDSTLSGDITGSGTATATITVSGSGSTLLGDVFQNDEAAVTIILDNRATGQGGFAGGNLITGGDSAWTFNKDSHGNYGENHGSWNIGDYDVIFDNLTHSGTVNLSVNSDTGEGGSITITDTADGDGTVHIDTTGNGQADPNQVLPGKVTGEGTEHWQWDPIDWGIDTIIKDGDHFIKQGTSPAGAVLNSSVAIQQAMWFAQQNSLLKRMGELRYGARASRPPAGGTPAFHNLIENIWLRSYGQQLNVGSQVSGKAYEQLIYGVDLGTDHKFTLNADSDLYLGVYAGYGRSDLDYRTPGTDSELNSYYSGLYATWLHSSGFYIDATVKAASVDNNLKAPYSGSQITASYSDVNLGGSIEIGKKFTFADAWFIEPQLQVNYLHILAEDYTAGPMSLKAQDLDALQLRIGSLFGRTIKLTNSGALQPYIKISGVETISSGGTIRNGYQSTRANTDGARAELGGGLIWQLNASNQLHLDYEASFGDKYDKPWGLTAGYRHQF